MATLVCKHRSSGGTKEGAGAAGSFQFGCEPNLKLQNFWPGDMHPCLECVRNMSGVLPFLEVRL